MVETIDTRLPGVYYMGPNSERALTTVVTLRALQAIWRAPRTTVARVNICLTCSGSATVLTATLSQPPSATSGGAATLSCEASHATGGWRSQPSAHTEPQALG